ncbi:MAG TPA: hypothetical protein VMU34_02390 [Mycobacterium sp.]|nr:hypothetical protein [Mycobacterium sp.]
MSVCQSPAIAMRAGGARKERAEDRHIGAANEATRDRGLTMIGSRVRGRGGARHSDAQHLGAY